MYRVRLGPYATARELEEAKRQLASNGVPDTLAVREAIP
jgi:cell division protein FtsN